MRDHGGKRKRERGRERGGRERERERERKREKDLNMRHSVLLPITLYLFYNLDLNDFDIMIN